MSDFDKEAERQRLREKYDDDGPRRQETARMSELLLKGATMTNKHCDDCGAPVFRYDGQEFCPNCQGGESADAESADAAEPAATGEADASATAGGSAEAVTPESDRPANGEATVPSEQGSDVDREAVTSTRASDSADAAEPSGASPSASSSSPTSSPSPASSAASGRSAGATATDAREALLRAVTTHATRGETADDPRRARDHLAAAREAAEALSALDR
ncbi:Uncharacterized Zn-finger containing protein, UPF0148 family [Halopelagius inordinatus]|uniref:Uncharacterized Zn-finger containing protein, UPF0148 family n=1 Tax=Halopelagius inordinatus TaxID=553467 RepID=A0A1I2WD96_9EURY|nr:Sjogren's syndrome/scleroderma autoantigen 1 family protein [Halopelagius inordinatus]SFG99323.1 Uncharacterized Zn-finger containing protein, UPF0148 family [Halopelagius inordinatus]